MVCHCQSSSWAYGKIQNNLGCTLLSSSMKGFRWGKTCHQLKKWTFQLWIVWKFWTLGIPQHACQTYEYLACQQVHTDIMCQRYITLSVEKKLDAPPKDVVQFYLQYFEFGCIKFSTFQLTDQRFEWVFDIQTFKKLFILLLCPKRVR